MSTATKAATKAEAIKPDQRVEEWLRGHGATFELVDLDLDLVNRDLSRQNQARIGEAVNSDTVLLYATAMDEGDEFPPLVVYKNASTYIVVDGNHRVAACDIVPIQSMRAYILDKPSPAQVMTLTYEANTKHGRPTTLQERIKQGVWMVETGAAQKDVSSILGVPLASLKSAWSKHQADKRFEEIGVRKFSSLTETARIKLNVIKNDVALKAAAQLAIDASYATEDIVALAGLVNAQRTEKGQIAVIAKEREERSVRIKASAGGRIPTPKRIITLQRAMTMLNRMSERNTDALSHDLRGLPQEMLADLGRSASQTTEVLMAVIRESRRPNAG